MGKKWYGVIGVVPIAGKVLRENAPPEALVSVARGSLEEGGGVLNPVYRLVCVVTRGASSLLSMVSRWLVLSQYLLGFVTIGTYMSCDVYDHELSRCNRRLIGLCLKAKSCLCLVAKSITIF